MPEEGLREAGKAEGLVRRGVFLQITVLARFPACEPEGEDQWEGADGVDDGPHPDTPLPCRVQEDGGGDVPGHPGVDDEREGGDEAEEHARAERGDVCDYYFNKEDDACVPDLIQHRAAGEGLHVRSARLDDRADRVEDDTHADEFDASEHVGDFRGRGLGGRGDDGPQHVDGREEGVVVVGGCRGGLVGVSDGAIKAVGVGD